MTQDREKTSMHGDKGNPGIGQAQTLRSMRQAMRESADMLKSAAPLHDEAADVDLARLYRIQDLQAEAVRLREALLNAVRHGDENYYRVLDLQDDVRGLQEEIRGLQEEIRGLQEGVRERDARVAALVSELEASHAREAAQQARYQAMELAKSSELAQWQAYAASLRGVMGDMLSSDSWRFTWFLRAISATLRGRKSTGPALPDAPATRGVGHDGG